MYIFLLAAG